MSKWITDRRPTEKDTDKSAIWLVWTTYNGEVIAWTYDGVAKGTPWMPISKPEPYVATKPRYTVAPNAYRNGEWAVEYDKMLIADKIPTKEAAERIAAIYNEVIE